MSSVLTHAAMLESENQRLRSALAQARDALTSVTFTERSPVDDEGRAVVPYATLMKCARAISAIDTAVKQSGG